MALIHIPPRIDTGMKGVQVTGALGYRARHHTVCAVPTVAVTSKMASRHLPFPPVSRFKYIKGPQVRPQFSPNVKRNHKPKDVASISWWMVRSSRETPSGEDFMNFKCRASSLWSPASQLSAEMNSISLNPKEPASYFLTTSLILLQLIFHSTAAKNMKQKQNASTAL